MTDEQRTDIVEDQLEHITYLCNSFQEVGEVENMRALYEEYGEWLDTYHELGNYEQGYTVIWAPNFLEV